MILPMVIGIANVIKERCVFSFFAPEALYWGDKYALIVNEVVCCYLSTNLPDRAYNFPGGRPEVT